MADSMFDPVRHPAARPDFSATAFSGIPPVKEFLDRALRDQAEKELATLELLLPTALGLGLGIAIIAHDAEFDLEANTARLRTEYRASTLIERGTIAYFSSLRSWEQFVERSA